MDQRISELLVCPSCRAKLLFARRDASRPTVVTDLVCTMERLAYPIREGMPILLREEAIDLPATDVALQ
jgi:uncharacterized protein YbaR (Trm112 family)